MMHLYINGAKNGVFSPALGQASELMPAQENGVMVEFS
jgi:hypothetical protein